LPWWAAAVLFITISAVEVLLLSLVSAATARLTLQRSINFYWRWAAVLAVLAIVSTVCMRFHA
jgi:formate hydrogenlyase subunit 4